ncbi:MAG: ABC transporter ATP-binding protein [Anaerolineales bacterium]|nr:ABC transporter ATP-binding protein [Anaerolineales bacterium]
MIQTEGLTKIFPGTGRGPDGKPLTVTAVDNLTLSVEEGEVFGFLGPNGAGKTTTVRMLCALISPTSGRAQVNGLTLGRDDQAIRQSVGILTETPGLYDRLSAEKNLVIFGKLYGVPDPLAQAHKYLKLFGLWERRLDPAGSFSKGMRQKLAIARALLHEPKVLFLDEPTGGLDPEAARLVRDAIEQLRGEGRTILLTTHNLAEADRLCDRIGIFKTRLVTVDTPANLRHRLYGRQVVFHLRRLDPAWVEAVRAQPFVKEARDVAGRLLVRLDDPETHNPVLLRQLIAAGADVQFVGELRHSLEDVYLQLLNDQVPRGTEPASKAPPSTF